MVAPSKKEVAQHLVSLLEKESVKYSKEDLVALLNVTYPDIRRTINTAQRSVINGELRLDKSTVVGYDYMVKIVEVLKSDKNKKEKFDSIRQIIADNYVKDFNLLMRYLYENVETYANGFVSSIILIVLIIWVVAIILIVTNIDGSINNIDSTT